MKSLMRILMGIGISVSAHAEITPEVFSSLCRRGVPDGLTAARMTTDSTRIFDSIVDRSSTPVFMKECTRTTSTINGEILNQGDKCAFRYEWEMGDITLYLPNVLKAKSMVFANGEVVIFETGFQPEFMSEVPITAICKRADGTGGYFGLMGDDGLIEFNP